MTHGRSIFAVPLNDTPPIVLAVVSALAVVAVVALPVILIPAVPAEIFAGVMAVRDDPFPIKLQAVTDPEMFALPDNHRFAHLFPVAPISF